MNFLEMLLNPPPNRLLAPGEPPASWLNADANPQAHTYLPPRKKQAAPMPAPQQAAPAQPQRQSGGGFLSGIGDFLSGGKQSALNRNVQWMMEQGANPAEAQIIASDPQRFTSWVLERTQAPKPIEINGRLVHPQTFEVLADFSDKDKDNAYLERQAAAKAFGLQENSPEYQRYILTGDLPSNREQDPAFKNEMDLRKEYDSLPEVKDYKVVRSNYERIRQGVQLGTGAGDAAIVFGYMKMLDPTSVVREGEQATTRNAAGVPEAIRGMYNQLIGGGQLSQEARNQILGAAEKVYGESSANIEEVNKRYGGYAQNWQLDPNRITSPVEQYDPLQINTPAPTDTPQPGMSAPPPGAPVMPDGEGWQELSPGIRFRKVQ